MGRESASGGRGQPQAMMTLDWGVIPSLKNKKTQPVILTLDWGERLTLKEKRQPQAMMGVLDWGEGVFLEKGKRF